MSVVLASARRLKPELRLAQAVSQFEADLSGEQKASFRTYKSQAHDSLPTTQDVMRFTAELDRKVSEKARGMRGFGPRLTNVLQAVQQYAALGDIVIGGSQNLVATGVWALVRTTLMLLVNFSSYLEKLSLLLMSVGRSAPRYQNMALLYPRSKDLQSYLSEYFIVVIRLCHQTLKFTQKSRLGQLASSLSDADLKVYQSELDAWANSIKEEVNFLLSRSIEDEHQESSRFRSLLKLNSQSEWLRRKIEKEQRILDSCSTYDFGTTWKQTRKIGNTTLFNTFPEYQEWKIGTSASSLICRGKLGSGKSVLLSNIVDDINLHAHDRGSAVAYFFCRHDIAESLRASVIIGSLVRQLLAATLNRRASDGHERAWSSDIDTTALLLLSLPVGEKAYIVLDGIDECESTEVAALVKGLRDLQEKCALLICVSSRHEAGDILGHQLGQLVDPRTVMIPDDNPDIEGYVTGELERVIDLGKLALGDPTLILEIREALLAGAQGMFLWVALQIETLCTEKTDQAIRLALAHLPRDLSETFRRILLKSDRTGKAYQMRVLELVIAARRPLTVEELREALSVVPGSTTWNPANLINDIYSTLACCGSLLHIDEEELTVRFVHHSVKQYILTDFTDPAGARCTVSTANAAMAVVIATYLNYGVFDTKLSTSVVPRVHIGSAPSQVIDAVLGSRSENSTRSLAMKLLKTARRPDYDIGKTLADARKQFRASTVQDFLFHVYALSHWMSHLGCLRNEETGVLHLLYRLLDTGIIDADATDEHGRDLLSYAAEKGSQLLVASLLHKYPYIRGARRRGKPPLWYAAAQGRQAIIHLLLRCGYKPVLYPVPLWSGQAYDPEDAKSHFAAYLLFPAPLQEATETVPVSLLLDVYDERLDKVNSPYPPMLYAVESMHHHTRQTRAICSLADVLQGRVDPGIEIHMSLYRLIPMAFRLAVAFQTLLQEGRCFRTWDANKVVFLRAADNPRNILLHRCYISTNLYPVPDEQLGPTIETVESFGKLLCDLLRQNLTSKFRWCCKLDVGRSSASPALLPQRDLLGDVREIIRQLRTELDTAIDEELARDDDLSDS